MTEPLFQANHSADRTPGALTRLAFSGALVGTLSAALVASPALATDGGAPSAAAEPPPLADIQSVYAWMNQDATAVNLAMTVAPFDDGINPFGDEFQYVFHVAAHAQMMQSPVKETRVICQFVSEADVECWVGDKYLRVNPTVIGARNDALGIQVFAGRRSDPFFFHEAGFRKALLKLRALAPPATTPQQCAAIPPDQGRATLLDLRNAAVDRYIDTNVLALVVVIDKDLLNISSFAPILSVWGSTHRR